MTQQGGSFCTECGSRLEAGVHFCAECGHAVPGAAGAPTAPTAAVPPTAPMAAVPPAAPPPAAPPPGVAPGGPPAPRSRGGLYALLGIVGTLVVLAIIGSVLFLVADDDAAADEVLLEAAGAPTENPFTSSVSATPDRAPGEGDDPVTPTASSTPAPAATAGRQQAGSTPGLYGGTRDAGSCDPEQLIAFLQATPDKAAAWASVQGIAVADIPTYVRSLTPVVLAYDTRVTNHGFSNGSATVIPAVLQAGTAVLVDAWGTPRVKCACGNPLTPPPPVTTSTTYVGTRWRGFSEATVVHVTIEVEVTVFVLIDVDTGLPFDRPVGTDGADDGDTPLDTTCDLVPDDPICQPTTTTTTTTTTTAPPPTPAPTPAPTAPPTQPPVTAAPPPPSPDRSAEAEQWVADAIGACAGLEYVASITGWEEDYQLYHVDVLIVLDGTGEWTASYHVAFGTEDWPELTPLDDASADMICY